MLADGLEQVRAVLGVPVNVSSGYRCAPLNNAIGGASNSAHVKGYAADFTAAQFGTPRDIALKIYDSGIKFDQLILEGRWVHISFDERMRGEVLTAEFVNGRAVYSEGIK
jgi:putative chitinase